MRIHDAHLGSPRHAPARPRSRRRRAGRPARVSPPAAEHAGRETRTGRAVRIAAASRRVAPSPPQWPGEADARRLRSPPPPPPAPPPSPVAGGGGRGGEGAKGMPPPSATPPPSPLPARAKAPPRRPSPPRRAAAGRRSRAPPPPRPRLAPSGGTPPLSSMGTARRTRARRRAATAAQRLRAVRWADRSTHDGWDTSIDVFNCILIEARHDRPCAPRIDPRGATPVASRGRRLRPETGRPIDAWLTGPFDRPRARRRDAMFRSGKEKMARRRAPSEAALSSFDLLVHRASSRRHVVESFSRFGRTRTLLGARAFAEGSVGGGLDRGGPSHGSKKQGVRARWGASQRRRTILARTSPTPVDAPLTARALCPAASARGGEGAPTEGRE